MSGRRGFMVNLANHSASRYRKALRALSLLEKLEDRLLLTATASQPYAWINSGVGGTGTEYYANVNPLNTQEIYLESDMGETWHTINGGLVWQTMDQDLQVSSGQAENYVQYTNNANIQYAINGGTSNLGPNTPRVTNDDGQTWTNLPGWAAIKANGAPIFICADPNSSSRIVLSQAVFNSSNSTWNYNIWFSNDSGNTFSSITSDATGTDPTKPWLAGMFWDTASGHTNIYLATDVGLFTSSDTGATWNKSSLTFPNMPNGNGETYFSFAGSTSGGTTRLWAISYDVTTLTDNPHLLTNNFKLDFGGLFTMTVGQSSWTNMTSPFWATNSGADLYPRQVQMAENDITDIWIGGSEAYASSSVVYKSNNTGSSWTKLLLTGYDTTNFPTETPNQNIYTHQYGVGGTFNWGYIGGTITFLVNRANPQIMTFTAAGTLFESIDGGTTWYDISSGGPSTPSQGSTTGAFVQPTSLNPDPYYYNTTNLEWNPSGQAINPQAPNPTSSLNETSGWDMTFVNPTTILQDDTDVTFQHTTDNGVHWNFPAFQTGMPVPNSYYQSVYDARTGVLYAVTSGSHDMYYGRMNDASVEQLGDNRLVMSTDQGETWAIVYTFPSASPARALGLDPLNPNLLYVGLANHTQYNPNTPTTPGGGIFVVTNLAAVATGSAASVTYLANQPQRAGAFSAMHPAQILVVNDANWATDGNTDPNHEMIVAVMGPRGNNAGVVQPNAGIWTSIDSGTTWIDRSTVDGIDTGLQNWTMNITIDPNDPTQATWFASEFASGASKTGNIYKTTNYGATWTVFSSINAGSKVWIQPGGTMMLYGSKGAGLLYCPDYTAANPQFYSEASFPFDNITNIISNPYNSNQIWVTTFGNGAYYTDLSQITTAAVVTNLQAVSMSSSEALLNWTVQAPLPTNFIIQYSTSSNFSTYTSVTVPSGTDTSYLVTGLSAGTLYYFRVLSTNSAGNSGPSTVVSIRTDMAPNLFAVEEFTQALGNLNGTGSGTGWSGTWTAGSNATVIANNFAPANPPASAGNAMQLANGTTNASRTSTTTVGTAGTVVWASMEEYTGRASGLLLGDTTNGFGFGAPDSNYKLGFVVYNGGTATYFDTTTAYTGTTKVFIVARIQFESSATYVNLYINPTPGLTYPDAPATWAAGGNLLVIPNSGSTAITPSAVVTLLDGTLTAKFDEIRLGRTYVDVSPPVTAVGNPAAPNSPLSAIVPPKHFTSQTDLNPNEIDLSWTNATQTNPQQGIQIEQSSNGGSSWTVLEKIYDPSALVTSYTVTNLAAATAYLFRIKAYNNTGSSAYVTSSSVSTLSTPPAAVTNLAVAVSNSTFNLTWSDVAGDTGYQLQYANDNLTHNPANDGELNWTSVPLAANSNSWSTSSLLANTLYYFRIYSSNTGGNSTCSNVVSQTCYAAPTNVTAVGISNNQVNIAWTDPTSSMTGFNARYSTDQTNWTTVSNVSPGGSNMAVVSVPNANTQYYFQVQAYATNSTGSWSTSAVARTLSTNSALLAYEGFNYNYVAGVTRNMDGQSGGNGFAGTWTGTAGGSSATYSIASGSPVDSNSTVATDLLTTGNSLSTTNAGSISRNFTSSIASTPGTSVWVSALLTENGSSPGGSVQLLGGAYTIKFGVVLSGKFSIQIVGAGKSWTSAVAPTVGNTCLLVLQLTFGATNTVNLWVDPDPSQSSPGTALLTGTFTNALPAITGATLATGSGDSEIWDELRVGTSYAAVVPLKLPTAPIGLTAAANSSNIVLNWTDNSTAPQETGFNVERSIDQITWSHLGSSPTVGTGVHTYTDTPAAGTYYYRVSAADATGDSIDSNIASATLTTAPNTPTGLTATASTSAISIGLSWSESSTGTIYYNVQRSLTGTGGWSSVATGVTLTSWTDSTVSPNTIYYYQVNAYYTVGNYSAWSTNSNAALTIPAAPSNLVATPGTSTITLTWTDPSPTTNITGYHIYRSSDNTNFSFYANATGNTTSTYADTNPGNGTPWYYKVTAYDATGESTTGAGMTYVVATVIASDGFNYGSVTGTNPWSGGNTGLGFASGWVISNTSNASIVPNLSYSPGGHALITSGSGVALKASATATQTLATTVGNPGSVLWISYEFSTASGQAELWLGPNTNSQVEIGAYLSSKIDAFAWYNGTRYQAVTNYGVVTNTTYFVVAQITYATTGDVVTVYVNPQPGGTSPTNYVATGTVTLPSASQLSPTTTIYFSPGPSGSSFNSFDELRVGNTFASVAPDPYVPPSSLSSPVATLSPISSVVLLTSAPDSSVEFLFNPILAAPPIPTASLNFHSATPHQEFHTYASDSSSRTSDALTLDNPNELFIQLPHH